MSDDKLAEALMQSWHSTTWEGPTLVCECGWEVDMLDMETEPQAQGCEDAWQTHLFETLAATARAFIADELHAFGEQHSVGAYGTYGPPAIALSDAESIARGDTK